MLRKLVVAGVIGAAVMYFLDAENGIQRRAKALDYIDARLADLNTLVGPAQPTVGQLTNYDSATELEPATMLNRQRGGRRSSPRIAKSTTSDSF